MAVRWIATTFPAEVAEKVVETRVEEEWIACANLVQGATSIYRWDGKIQRDRETLGFLKTRDDLVDGLMTRLGDLHPYDVPEILVLEVTDGFAPYLAWVAEVTR